MTAVKLLRYASDRILGGWVPLLCVLLGSLVAFLMPLVGVENECCVSLRGIAPQWASHALDWLVYGKKVKVILYEDLKTNLLSTLKEMVQFLGLEVSEDRLLCVEAQKDGNFKRQGQQKLEYDPYTPAMEAIMNELIRKVDAALKERKLPGIAEECVR